MVVNAPPRPVSSFSLLVILYIAGAAISGITYLKPIIVGALIDGFGFSPTRAGFVVGIETSGIGLGTALIALFGITWDRRRLAVAGSALAMLAALAPVFAHTFEWLLLERLLAGVGTGLVASAVLGMLATFPNPDRAFGFYYSSIHVTAAVLVPITAGLARANGAVGAYRVLAGLSLVSLLCAFRFPANIHEKKAVKLARGLPSRGAIALLPITLIYWAGTGVVWAFVERVGVSHGFSRISVGGVLGVSQLASLAGALSASLIALRFGRLVPIASAIGVSVLSLMLMKYSAPLVGFAAGNLAFNFACLVVTTFVSGVMATLDPSGRIVVLGIISQGLGLALGPSIGGVLASYESYDSVLWLGLACHLSAFGLLTAVLLRARPRAIQL